MLTAAQLHALCDVALEYGSGTLELTARGNIQVRGITDTSDVIPMLTTAGLLPSASHERVRNIVASPLSGRRGGLADVRPWVTSLDQAICADPVLAGLSGRFWFGLDDGRGDVSGLGADVGVQVLPHVPGDDGSGVVALLLAGRDTGVRLTPNEVVPRLVELARRFVEIRGTAWRVGELEDPAALLDEAATLSVGLFSPPALTAPVGWIDQDQPGLVTLGAAVPAGVLPERVGRYLAAIEAPLVITPWRSVLVCDLDESVADVALRVLAPMGLVFDENSPWLRVSSCTGSPGCAKSAGDVRGDLTAMVNAALAAELNDRPGVHRHFVGCDRACGSPPSAEVLVTDGNGYRVLRS